MSLLVLLVPIAIVVGLQKYLFDGDEPIAVNPATAVADARATAGFPVVEPGTPDGWTITSARFQLPAGGATLRIGYVDAARRPVLLVQSSVPVTQLLPAELGETAKAGGAVPIGAARWQRYDSTRGEPALVLREPGHTVVVVGATDEAALRELVVALR